MTNMSQVGKVHSIKALVLPKITSNAPAYAVSIMQEWKHLAGLFLADANYGTPGAVNLLLGADVLVLHDQQFGPSGSPSALKTQFGWVLAGSIGSKDPVVPVACSENCHFQVVGLTQSE